MPRLLITKMRFPKAIYGLEKLPTAAITPAVMDLVSMGEVSREWAYIVVNCLTWNEEVKRRSCLFTCVFSLRSDGNMV